jgi:hypothetical protein
MTEENLKEPLNKKNNQEKTSLRVIRTYNSDIVEAMNKKKESVVSIVAAENKRRLQNEEFELDAGAQKRESFKKISTVVLSATLFVLGIGSAFYFYGTSGGETAPSASKISSIIFSDEEEEFEITNLSRRQILNELAVIKDNIDLSAGEIENIFITESLDDKDGVIRKELISASDFFNAINARLSASFMRSLKPEFMLGIYMSGGNQPFLILKTSFYENAFTGMLEWERDIKDDLAPLFGLANSSAILNEDFGTSTLSIVTPTFSDFVVKNKDARILKNNDGTIALIYSFIDKNTIVITTSENTFGEILARLR